MKAKENLQSKETLKSEVQLLQAQLERDEQALDLMCENSKLIDGQTNEQAADYDSVKAEFAVVKGPLKKLAAHLENGSEASTSETSQFNLNQPVTETSLWNKKGKFPLNLKAGLRKLWNVGTGKKQTQSHSVNLITLNEWYTEIDKECQQTSQLVDELLKWSNQCVNNQLLSDYKPSLTKDCEYLDEGELKNKVNEFINIQSMPENLKGSLDQLKTAQALSLEIKQSLHLEKRMGRLVQRHQDMEQLIQTVDNQHLPNGFNALANAIQKQIMDNKNSGIKEVVEIENAHGRLLSKLDATEYRRLLRLREDAFKRLNSWLPSHNRAAMFSQFQSLDLMVQIIDNSASPSQTLASLKTNLKQTMNGYDQFIVRCDSPINSLLDQLFGELIQPDQIDQLKDDRAKRIVRTAFRKARDETKHPHQRLADVFSYLFEKDRTHHDAATRLDQVRAANEYGKTIAYYIDKNKQTIDQAQVASGFQTKTKPLEHYRTVAKLHHVQAILEALKEGDDQAKSLSETFKTKLEADEANAPAALENDNFSAHLRIHQALSDCLEYLTQEIKSCHFEERSYQGQLVRAREQVERFKETFKKNSQSRGLQSLPLLNSILKTVSLSKSLKAKYESACALKQLPNYIQDSKVKQLVKACLSGDGALSTAQINAFEATLKAQKPAMAHKRQSILDDLMKNLETIDERAKHVENELETFNQYCDKIDAGEVDQPKQIDIGTNPYSFHHTQKPNAELANYEQKAVFKPTGTIG